MRPVVSTGYKRLFLRCVKIDAAARGLSVLDVLNECATAQVKKTAGGIFISQAQGNGQLYQVLPNAGEGLTPVSFAELVSELIDRYEEGKSALINEDGIASPTDAQIYAEVFSKLTPVTAVRPDFSTISR